MTLDQARAEAGRRWCQDGLTRPVAWILPSGVRAVGYTDGYIRHMMGKGETWEDALSAGGGVSPQSDSRD